MPVEQPEVAAVRCGAVEQHVPPVRRPDGIIDPDVRIIELEHPPRRRARHGIGEQRLVAAHVEDQRLVGRPRHVAAAGHVRQRRDRAIGHVEPHDPASRCRSPRGTRASGHPGSSAGSARRRPPVLTRRWPVPSACMTHTSVRPCAVRHERDQRAVGRHGGIGVHRGIARSSRREPAIGHPNRPDVAVARAGREERQPPAVGRPGRLIVAARAAGDPAVGAGPTSCSQRFISPSRSELKAIVRPSGDQAPRLSTRVDDDHRRCGDAGAQRPSRARPAVATDRR